MLVSRSRAGHSPAAPAFPYFPRSVLHLLALGPQACRWPSGDLMQGTLAYCGAPRVGQASYCAHHKALACEAIR